jgi:aspartyl-tRNA(Asn)/glutamyl-tRNA(Gln) amidotransferase subunit C
MACRTPALRHALEGSAWRGYTVCTVQERPMAIDTDTARKVAKLARIRVEEADLPALARELSGILGFMEQLNEVDVTGVEPMTSVTPMRLRRRVDAVTDGGIQAAILANAPDAREGFFAVPKVVE